MLDFLTDALAAHRITRLVMSDAILDGPRDRLKQYLHDEGHPKAITFLQCPWCLSVWCAFGIVAARRYCPEAWQPIARALALSDVAGIVATFCP